MTSIMTQLHTWDLLILIATPFIVVVAHSANLLEQNQDKDGDAIMSRNSNLVHLVNRELRHGKGKKHKPQQNRSCDCCEFISKSECEDQVDPDCIWCYATANDGKCIKSYLDSSGHGREKGYRRGNACCKVATDEQSCGNNSDYGPTCVWATGKTIDATPLYLEWCEALNCNMIKNEIDCTMDYGCIWNVDQCDWFDCHKLTQDGQDECEAAANGTACVWKTTTSYWGVNTALCENA